jgi:DNA-binding MarR family transcriptional regulator
MIDDQERRTLALQMVQILPSFGNWASSIRNFETPFGRIGLRQLSILYIMRYPGTFHADPTPRYLAQAFEVQPSVITRALARLEEHGFIDRVQDPDDRRVARLSITDKGREISVYVEDLFIREMMKSTAFLSSDEVDELTGWMKVLAGVRDDLHSRKNLGTSDLLTSAARDDEAEDE